MSRIVLCPRVVRPTWRDIEKAGCRKASQPADKPNSVRLRSRPPLGGRELRRDDHSSRPVIAHRLQRPTRRHRTGRSIEPPAFADAPLPPYLVLLRAGFCLPPTLPPARCALTAPFHPYSPSSSGLRRSRPASPYGVDGLASPKRRRREGGRYIFCATSPSGCPARALPGALPCGVRTFLSLRHFAMVCGCRTQRSSGQLRRFHYRLKELEHRT